MTRCSRARTDSGPTRAIRPASKRSPLQCREPRGRSPAVHMPLVRERHPDVRPSTLDPQNSTCVGYGSVCQVPGSRLGSAGSSSKPELRNQHGVFVPPADGTGIRTVIPDLEPGTGHPEPCPIRVIQGYVRKSCRSSWHCRGCRCLAAWNARSAPDAPGSSGVGTSTSRRIIRAHMLLPVGTRLGPYEILSLTGAGGMGEVYRARDTRLDRTVAVKVLTPELASDVEFRDGSRTRQGDLGPQSSAYLRPVRHRP